VLHEAVERLEDLAQPVHHILVRVSNGRLVGIDVMISITTWFIGAMGTHVLQQ
jgi:hypothetical protein